MKAPAGVVFSAIESRATEVLTDGCISSINAINKIRVCCFFLACVKEMYDIAMSKRYTIPMVEKIPTRPVAQSRKTVWIKICSTNADVASVDVSSLMSPLPRSLALRSHKGI